MASLDLGDQVLAEWIPLRGISYDPRDKALFISLGREGKVSVEHLIRDPREVYVQEETSGISNIGVADKNGNTEIIRFRDLLQLPGADRPAAEQLETR